MNYLLALLFLTLSACATGEKANVPFATDADGQAHVNLPGEYRVEVYRGSESKPVPAIATPGSSASSLMASTNPLPTPTRNGSAGRRIIFASMT